MALVGEGGGGGDWLTAAPVAAPVSNVAVMEAQDPGNYQQMAVIPEWQKKGFASEEEFLAVQQRAMMQNGAAPTYDSSAVLGQQINPASGREFDIQYNVLNGANSMGKEGGYVWTPTGFAYYPGVTLGRREDPLVAPKTVESSEPASGGNPFDAVGGWLGGVLNQIKNDALPPGMYPKGEGPTSIEQVRGTGGGVTGNVQSVDPYANIESARQLPRAATAAPPATVWDTGAPPPPATVWDGPTPGNPTYGRTFGEGNGIPFDVERNARLLEEQYKQRTTQPGNPVYGRTFGNGGPAVSAPPLNPDPRNTGGTWATNPNNPLPYIISGDVYTGERRGNPDGYATGFTNTNNLTEDAVTGYLSLENNRPRGMAQMVTPAGEMGRQPMPRPATPPRGPQPNDDPVSPSLPSPKPQPLPPGSVATPILDGAGNQVATKVTLPDGRTVWNIPNKNWDGSFGFPWTPPANFDLPAWLRDKTEGRPAPVQQDALRNRAQALPQQNLGQQIQQQVQQQIQQQIPAAPALPVAQGVPNAQALRESILQNVLGR